jgi:hypothetical protein
MCIVLYYLSAGTRSWISSNRTATFFRLLDENLLFNLKNKCSNSETMQHKHDQYMSVLL